MAAPATRSPGKALVFSPQEPVTAGGAAEQLERQIQTALRSGVQHVIIDLHDVSIVDSAGIRALIRGHTSAQRLGRRLTLVGPNPRVREEIGLLRLQDVPVPRTKRPWGLPSSPAPRGRIRFSS